MSTRSDLCLARFPQTLTLLYVIRKDLLTYKMIPDMQLEMVKENAMKGGRALLEKYCATLADAGFEPQTMLEFGTPQVVISEIDKMEPGLANELLARMLAAKSQFVIFEQNRILTNQ